MQSPTYVQELETLSPSAPARISTDRADMANGQIPLEIIYSFVSLRGKSSAGLVIAFTSARRQEGVTLVVRQLGRQLASYCREDVLIISPSELERLGVLDVEQIEVLGHSAAPGLWTVPSSNLTELPNSGSPREQEDLWRMLRNRFRYVLIDCSALETSGETLSLGPRIDGAVLVVRAGFTSKTEIQNAARLLSVGSTPFLGSILNARTYAVPGFLYRML
jgi:hypothetical protein